jgi:NADH-quinone oxidoreductase subunit L
MIKFAPLVPLFPLIGWAINGLWGKKMSKGASGFVGCATVFASFVLSVLIFAEINGSLQKIHTVKVFDWISSGMLSVPFEFRIDPLSSLFLLIITGIGFLIHVYSTGYMKTDEGFYRFFAYLNLFIFFMLLLVMGNNYLIMFVGWEGVGLCSYLLIGFWFKNNEYNKAANKAFIMNRIGDLGFILGIILIFISTSSVTYSNVFEGLSHVSAGMKTAIGLLLFIGAMGKSAQIPLYTWLPDAMAGPTPVSALIHAATMVTAGVYMVVRSNAIFASSEITLMVVAVIGLATMLFAATIGFLQNDIKKILAYSTVSQLGLMFLALGAGAFTSGIFHVTTHAFFKALLFLGAGSVIHAMHHEQDIRKMGGLKKKLPITFGTMLIATIAISGIPPFSGFFSKDEILAYVYEYDKTHVMWFLASIASMFTAFYMFRMLYLTFWGSFRGTQHQADHLHESPKSMTIPLMVLAFLSVFGGFIGMPEFLGTSHWLNSFLQPVLEKHVAMLPDHHTEIYLVIFAVVSALATIWFTYQMFVKNKVVPVENEKQLKPWQRLIFHKYKIDELYDAVFTRPLNAMSAGLEWIDKKIIDEVINGVGVVVYWTGGMVRLLQNGKIGFYIFGMVIGIILIIFFGVIK